MGKEEEKDIKRELEGIHKEDKEFMGEEKKEVEKLKKEASEQ